MCQPLYQVLVPKTKPDEGDKGELRGQVQLVNVVLVKRRANVTATKGRSSAILPANSQHVWPRRELENNPSHTGKFLICSWWSPLVKDRGLGAGLARQEK